MRIGHLPQHIGVEVEHNLRSAKSLNLRSAGFTEMDPGGGTEIPLMRRILRPGQVFTDDIGPHSQEVPIAAWPTRFNKVTGHDVVNISPDLGLGVHNDRYYTVVRWAKGLLPKRKRKWAHIALHLNAGIQDPHTGKMRDSRAVSVTETAVRRVEAEIDSLVADGYEVVVSGDWNYRLHKGVPLWDFSPQKVAERHHMAIYSNGLDHVMWTRGLVRMGPVRVYPGGSGFNRADHPWFVIRLVFRPWARAAKA